MTPLIRLSSYNENQVNYEYDKTYKMKGLSTGSTLKKYNEVIMISRHQDDTITQVKGGPSQIYDLPVYHTQTNKQMLKQ